MSEQENQIAEIDNCELHIAGIGASAGGLEAIESLFKAMPNDTGIAFVLVQHLSPDFKSHMDQLLARHTDMAIYRVEDGMVVEPNSIYLIPPKKEMIIANGKLLLTDKDPSRGLAMPIDQFMRSLAADCGRRAIGIILSGTGSDGSRGAQSINEAGGLVLCQSEETARFDGMPLNAQETGCVHMILAPEAMPIVLNRYVGEGLTPKKLAEEEANVSEESGIDQIFRLLRVQYGIDFSHYKWNTVSRRLERRLTMQQSHDLGDYIERLNDDPQELTALYKDLLIGVTRFFRDRDAFEKLSSEILPELVARASATEPLRIWVAACATGEEAYSLAILLSEALEKANKPINFTLFATDVHRDSLEFASRGIYSEDALVDVSEERKKYFFRQTREGYQVIQSLRQQIVFAPHNLINDAPFTRLDLVTCRNFLIYLKPLAQKKVLSLFHFSLRMGGVLFLGPSEHPAELSDEFECLNTTWKIYRKRRDIRLPAELRLPLPSSSNLINPVTAGGKTLVDTGRNDNELLATYDRLLEIHMPPSFLLDEKFQLLHSFGGAERYLKVRGGRASTYVLDMVGDDLKTALAGALQHALKDRSEVRYGGIVFQSDNKQETLRLVVQPLYEPRTNVTQLLVKLETMQPKAVP